MNEFEIGKEYACMLNGQFRNFTIADQADERFDYNWFWIRWDDGEYEMASVADMTRWCNEALII